jgi:hypothetical protein
MSAIVVPRVTRGTFRDKANERPRTSTLAAGLETNVPSVGIRRMRRELASALAAASVPLASAMSIPTARADPPPSLRVVALEAGCPTAKQVATLLERMLPRTKITADSGPPSAADAVVSDQGAHFQVTVAGQERSFDDAARQCPERARHVAVFIAMVLDPPMIAELSPASPPVQAAPAAPVDAARRPERPAGGWQSDVTLGAVLLVAPQGERRQTAVAQGVAAFARAKHGWHLAFGAGVLRGALRFDDAAANAWWIPIDIGAGFSTRAKAWEIGAEIGPSASILFIKGENLKDARTEVRLEVGGRVAAWSRFWLSRQFAAFLSAEAVVRPFPHVLDIDPRGAVGEMPLVWLGASAGIAAALE